MEKKILIVVGDDYAALTQHPNVLTSSQLRTELAAPGRWTGTETVIIGQGLDATERKALQQLARRHGLPAFIEPEALAPLHLTHKASADHVLISAPERVDAGSYRFAFVVGGARDRLSDHVTGQHVGGMLILEAARQAGIAAVEVGYAVPGVKWGFLLTGVQASFESYVFPLPTTLLVTLTEDVEKRRDKQVTLDVVVKLLQASAHVCTVHFFLTLIESELLTKLETKRAQRTLESLRASCPANAPAALFAKTAT